MNLSEPPTDPLLMRFQAIGDIPMELRAELDRRPITCRELLELQVGSLLVLTRPTGENIDVFVGEVLIGTGEILVIDTTLAVRVADLHDQPNGFSRDHATHEPETPPAPPADN